MGKAFYDHIDMMNIFGCGRDKGYAIIRSIKSYSDTVGIIGKVTKADFEAWYNRPLKNNAGSPTTNIVP